MSAERGQRIGCRHAKLEPRSLCPTCGAMVSAMDVRSYIEAERWSSSTTEWRVSIQRDADGTPVSMGWTPPWWGGKVPA